MPTSALDKLTRLHITYPMLFELHNGQKEHMTHAGVLEFVAEEGKVYLPNWVRPTQLEKGHVANIISQMMQTLLLEAGDLVQIKSADLAAATLVKLQPQSTNFLDISDPKAVLENAFRNFSTLTKGDIFSFHYNDTVYDVAVLEVKPESEKMGVSMLETDVSVDFAPPVGYVEPERNRSSGTSTPRSIKGGLMHNQGTMAQAINYDAIAPSSTTAAASARAVSSNFLLGGQRLNAKKGSKPPTPKASTPVAGSSTNPPQPVVVRRTNGPQPLRLPPNKLFFGYEIKPVKSQADKDKENDESQQPKFAGRGQTLRGQTVRGGVKRKGDGDDKEKEEKPPAKKDENTGRRLDGRKT
jgi:ubiquitin fusion degradation protein 1